MKPYWDSSALIEASLDASLEQRLVDEGGYTRSHTLTEMFAALTGKQNLRIQGNDAARAIKSFAVHLEFVDLSQDEILDGLSHAQARGVRGGRVHDYVHALAASKAGATALLTLDQNDFTGLVPGLSIEQV